MSAEPTDVRPPTRAQHWRASLGQALVVLGALALGIFGSQGLSSSQRAPERQERPRSTPLVSVEPIVVREVQLEIEGQGTLRARTELALAAQVGGRVLAVHPELRPGGRIAAGAVLLELERSDLELALAQAHAERAGAETQLANQRAEAAAALAEWEALGAGTPPPLVSRGPQIAEAEARLAAALARIERARLDLERCTLRAPFAACVLEARVAAGDLVQAGAQLGRLYDTSRFEIPVPVEDHELAQLAVPGLNADAGAGSPVEALVRLGGQSWRCPGRIVRIEGELDPRTRLARLVAEIEPPEIGPDGRRAALLPGAFAQLRLAARKLEGVVRVERQHLDEEGLAWVVVGGRLARMRPEVVFAADAELYVRGLPAGAGLLTTRLAIATEGMAVRTAEAAP